MVLYRKQTTANLTQTEFKWRAIPDICGSNEYTTGAGSFTCFDTHPCYSSTRYIYIYSPLERASIYLKRESAVFFFRVRRRMKHFERTRNLTKKNTVDTTPLGHSMSAGSRAVATAVASHTLRPGLTQHIREYSWVLFSCAISLLFRQRFFFLIFWFPKTWMTFNSARFFRGCWNSQNCDTTPPYRGTRFTKIEKIWKKM